MCTAFCFLLPPHFKNTHTHTRFEGSGRAAARFLFVSFFFVLFFSACKIKKANRLHAVGSGEREIGANREREKGKQEENSKQKKKGREGVKQFPF